MPTEYDYKYLKKVRSIRLTDELKEKATKAFNTRYANAHTSDWKERIMSFSEYVEYLIKADIKRLEEKYDKTF